jgi:hypothetical protein
MDLRLSMFREVIRVVADDYVRQPLWDFPPNLRKPLLSERRRRFGIEEERIDPATLTEDDD